MIQRVAECHTDLLDEVQFTPETFQSALLRAESEKLNFQVLIISLFEIFFLFNI